MNRYIRSFLFLLVYCGLIFLSNASKSYGQISRDSLNAIVSEADSYDKSEVVNSIQYLEKNLPIIKDTLDPNYVAWIYEYMAHGYLKLGDYNKSEDVATEGLKLVSSKTDDRSNDARVRLKCLLGIVLREQGLHKDSEQVYQEALSKSTSANDSLYILNNLGNLYSEINEMPKAYQTYQTGLSLISRGSANATIKANFLDNLGNAKSKINDDEALQLLNAGLTIRDSLRDPEKLFSSYRHLQQHFKRNKETDSAIKYAQNAFKISEQIADRTFKKEALGMLIDLNQSGFGKQYKILSDSIYQKNEEVQNEYAYLKFGKEEAENRALKYQNDFLRANELKILTFYLLSLAVFIGIAIVILILYRAKNKQRYAILMTEKRIAAEIHDGISNDLYQIMNKVEHDNFDSNVILDDLEVVYEKTRDISKSNSSIDFSPGFVVMINQLIKEYQVGEVRVLTKNLSKVEWKRFPKSKKEALYRILQELLNNTKKYGKASFIIIEFKQIGKRLKVTYKDNGVGAIITNTSGLGHAENRIANLGGSFTFESAPQKGFKAHINL